MIIDISEGASMLKHFLLPIAGFPSPPERATPAYTAQRERRGHRHKWPRQEGARKPKEWSLVGLFDASSQESGRGRDKVDHPQAVYSQRRAGTSSTRGEATRRCRSRASVWSPSRVCWASSASRSSGGLRCSGKWVQTGF